MPGKSVIFVFPNRRLFRGFGQGLPGIGPAAPDRIGGPGPASNEALI